MPSETTFSLTEVTDSPIKCQKITKSVPDNSSVCCLREASSSYGTGCSHGAENIQLANRIQAGVVSTAVYSVPVVYLEKTGDSWLAGTPVLTRSDASEVNDFAGM